jgi:hypothetical protein
MTKCDADAKGASVPTPVDGAPDGAAIRIRRHDETKISASDAMQHAAHVHAWVEEKLRLFFSESTAPTAAELAEHGAAWGAHLKADELTAKARSVRSMPPPATVAELLKRERLMSDLEAQADAVRPPSAMTGRPIPEVAARALVSLEERSRGAGVPNGAEDPVQRRARRAERFAQLNGRLEKHGDGWRTVGQRGALAELAREEKSAGRPMCDKSDVRVDLIAALRD